MLRIANNMMYKTASRATRDHVGAKRRLPERVRKTHKNRGGVLSNHTNKAHPPTFCLFYAVFGFHS